MCISLSMADTLSIPPRICRLKHQSLEDPLDGNSKATSPEIYRFFIGRESKKEASESTAILPDWLLWGDVVQKITTADTAKDMGHLDHWTNDPKRWCFGKGILRKMTPQFWLFFGSWRVGNFVEKLRLIKYLNITIPSETLMILLSVEPDKFKCPVNGIFLANGNRPKFGR